MVVANPSHQYIFIPENMLAMPIEPGKEPSGPPQFIFIGPDSKSQVTALDSHGTQVASFTVDGHKGVFTISRNDKSTSSSTVICTCETSHITGIKTMDIHGHSATLKSEAHFEVTTANGPLKWHIVYGLDSKKSWHDENKNVVAKGSKKDKRLEVFVAGDEMVLDCLLASWVPMLLEESPTTKGLVMSFKILGHLMGS